MPEIAPSPEQVRAALDELLGWQGISRSPQLADLLRYVVETTLAGDEGAIKAYSIAVDVFGRPPSFDPQADPIVRVQARRLRTLLEQFYGGGKAQSAVQIHLPLGRYVPEFAFAAQPAADPVVAMVAAPTERLRARRPRGWPTRRFTLNALLGLSFTLIGVALAVALIRWVLPGSAAPGAGAMPDIPAVTVLPFDNLTGEPVLDDDVAQVSTRLAALLAKFDVLRVTTDRAGFTLRGSVQEDGGRFVVKVMASQGDASGILWSGTVNPPAGTTDTAALTSAVVALAAQLGTASGPLQAPGRTWLSQQPAMPAQPGLYVCELQYMAWRDTRHVADAMRAADCFGQVLAGEPGNGIALAARAALRAWRIQYDSVPGQNLVTQLADETADVTRAVSLRPDSSFVHEQQALVLARQGQPAAAAALKAALELNPANIDAQAVAALLRWASGDFAGGEAMAEAAIAAVPSPPPWYYMTRAFDALREKRYFDAIDAAQALAAGDEEFGPVVALAAAPILGRNDLIDRYRPAILGSPHFQAGGILPRLDGLFHQQVLTDRVRDGLILAGVPPSALTGPFNADGTRRQ